VFNLRLPRLLLWGMAMAVVLIALPMQPAQQQQAAANYGMVGETDHFQLWVDPTTLAFHVVDKRSGFVWRSGLDAIEEGDRLNAAWQAFARSGISIEYLDERGVDRRVSITNSATTLEVTPIEQGVSALLTFTDYGITLNVLIQLEPDGVRVAVPFAGLREDNPDFRLGRVYLFPFLGAGRGGVVPGYMFLPDGVGSLIRFAETTRAQNMLVNRYYGPDLGMLGVLPYDPFISTPWPLTLPVYGIAHTAEQSALLSVVERGAAYGELNVHPAGVITNYNFIHHSFIYNQPFFQATNRAGAGVTTMQAAPNHFDVVVRYRFLTGAAADYVGMAHSYRTYLLERGLLPTTTIHNPNIPIRLEFLGGDHEPLLLWRRFVPMTTVAQLRDILAALALPNLEVVYYGWQAGGATSVMPTSPALESSLGTRDELLALAEAVTAAGGHFALYADPQAALWNEPGYNARTEIALAITDVYLLGYTRAVSHYFSLETLQQRFTTLTQAVAQHAPLGLALDSIGWNLYSDFRTQPPLNREQASATYQALLRAVPLPLALYRPNAYLLGVARAYYDLPLSDNGYVFTSETVPFLPIVLAGSMPYFGGALNFSSNQREDLLRLAEYGSYPSYFLTQEPTASMINTVSAWIYTSSYAQWGETIRTTYAWLNALLAPVRGQPISDHAQLADGVAATTYANGWQVIVNYTEQPFALDGITVPPRDALVRELAQ